MRTPEIRRANPGRLRSARATSPHPVFLAPHLSVLEVLWGHSLHPPVLLNVVPHLQVAGVRHEERVGCRRRFLELFQLQNDKGVNEES